ncbi:hypothetical protein GCM10027521_24120 [Amycolatopsis cihanbeyliensis]
MHHPAHRLRRGLVHEARFRDRTRLAHDELAGRALRGEEPHGGLDIGGRGVLPPHLGSQRGEMLAQHAGGGTGTGDAGPGTRKNLCSWGNY